MSELKKIAPATYELPKSGQMLVPGLIIATSHLLEEIERPLEQVRHVACLPGIIGYSIAMPDIHWGYGFPIGGVAAMDAEAGVISPGGVGYDINCGVRLALIEEPFVKFSEVTKQELLKEIFEQVPSGVGRGQKAERRIKDSDYRKIIEMGASWSIEQGDGLPEDLDHIESLGRIEGADFAAISPRAKERGSRQLGSIGSGNHFVEIGAVDRIFLLETAKAWGVADGMTYVLIHSGSRGFGHQICQDTLNEFIKKGFAEGLPDRQLVAAPINSPEGKKYFQAMAGAANFAFNNRQQILAGVRRAFQTVCKIPPKEVRLLYDVCHNIAKFEMHPVGDRQKRVCVHRKGATRAFGKGAEELSPLFKSTGQPVLVPGDMGRASYLLAGLGNPRTWCSSCHGAGRAKSRVQSMASWKNKDLKAHMLKEGVRVLASSMRTVAEEMPDAYKDVNTVVEAVEEARLADRVAKLKPSLVIKG